MKLDALQDALNRETQSGYRAKTISASTIGHECDAYIAYNLRGFLRAPRQARSQRILDLGQTLETEVVRALRAAGLEIDTHQNDGSQHMRTAYNGLVKVLCDGLTTIDGKPAILEIKSANKSRWTDLHEYGLELHSQTYWMQCQLMMWLFCIKQCLFVSYCKDDSAMHVELVRYDEFDVAWAKHRIDGILEDRETHRCAAEPQDWRCKACDFRQYCWEDKADLLNCRQCANCAYEHNSQSLWCNRNNREANAACDEFACWKPQQNNYRRQAT